MIDVVDSRKPSILSSIREVIRYKDLLLVLAYRDIRVKYAQTALGLIWAVVQPLLTVGILTIVFSKVAKVNTGNVPYPLFALVGMIGWSYYSFVLTQSGSSVIAAQNMVKKVYLPKIVLPLSKAMTGVVDLMVTMVFTGILLLFYSYPISGNIVYLPIVLLLLAFSALSIGILVSALTVRFRDIQHILPFIIQFGLYITPVAYKSEAVAKMMPETLRFAYYLNPVAGVIDALRWSIFGLEINWLYFSVSFAMTVVLFMMSFLYFNNVEMTIADIV